MTIVSQASQRSATRAASPVPDALKTTVASFGNRNCTLPGWARCQTTFVIVMGFQIPSQPLSMGSLQLGQSEARSVSGVIPEVSHAEGWCHLDSRATTPRMNAPADTTANGTGNALPAAILVARYSGDTRIPRPLSDLTQAASQGPVTRAAKRANRPLIPATTNIAAGSWIGL